MGRSDMIFLISAILIIRHLGLTTAQVSPFYRYHFCVGNNDTNTNTYQSNLKLLLSSQSYNDTGIKGFYNATIGKSPDRVYGLFLCRGDLSSQVCRICLNTCGEDLMSKCDSNQKEAIIWYDECMIRYSNRYFFSILEQKPGIFLSSPNQNVDKVTFDKDLKILTDYLVQQAAFGNSSSITRLTSTRLFAAREVNASQIIYGLAQCTPDISQVDCKECLQETVRTIPGCCYGKGGAHILRPSCSLRYESTPFYFLYNLPPLQPPINSSVPPSPINTITPNGSGGKSSSNIVVIVVPTIIGVLLLFVVSSYLLRKKTRTKSKTIIDKDEIEKPDSLQFDFGTIRIATNNFSDENKLGEGGFGAVYRGELADGQEIAVKRLSRNSGQGSHEFKNEVMLLHKLQHRNLVRLLGFCLEGEEKLLIYEYVPNRSLDKYIFDTNKREDLDWEMRHKIIGGIARGLLYLHEDSRLRIIHRDLKTGNILLDGEMIPKISDFGMAKLFDVDQTRGSTSRIAGTFGYMAPEYCLHGIFSVKSDVYSFGVLVLEIVSGQKINNFNRSGPSAYLLSQAWNYWREGTALELMDPTLKRSFSTNEVMKCIHIGLLCVQENIDDRPTMSSVVLMLNSHSITLASPSPPASFLESGWGLDQSTSGSMKYSANADSLVTEPR